MEWFEGWRRSWVARNVISAVSVELVATKPDAPASSAFVDLKVAAKLLRELDCADRALHSLRLPNGWPLSCGRA